MERAGNETPNLSLPSIVDYWLYKFFEKWFFTSFWRRKKIVRYLNDRVLFFSTLLCSQRFRLKGVFFCPNVQISHPNNILWLDSSQTHSMSCVQTWNLRLNWWRRSCAWRIADELYRWCVQGSVKNRWHFGDPLLAEEFQSDKILQTYHVPQREDCPLYICFCAGDLQKQ